MYGTSLQLTNRLNPRASVSQRRLPRPLDINLNAAHAGPPSPHCAMFSNLIYFALLQVACGLSIHNPHGGSNTNEARSPRLERRLETGVKVALGICIPGAVLVVGLGLVVLLLYPSQLRKLRRENPGADVGLADLMNGKVTHHPAPPPYTAGRTASTDASSTASHAPAYSTATPKADANAPTAPPPAAAALSPAEARHAALV
jgi:hypothetical protein